MIRDGLHILYEIADFIPERSVGCFVEESHRIGTAPLGYFSKQSAAQQLRQDVH